MRRISLLLVILIVAAFATQPIAAQPRPSHTFLQKSRVFVSSAEFARREGSRVRITRSARLQRRGSVLIGGLHGVVERTASGVLSPFPYDRVLPVDGITVVAEERPGVLWFGAKRGAIRYDESTRGIQYFGGMRWLPDDQVTGIGFSTDGDANLIWIETPKGFSRISYRPMTYSEKTALFEERIRKRHFRHGLTADSHLSRPGDLTSNRMASSDNDGLWTAMYVAAECFRYKETGSAEAREFAKLGMDAIIRLESITGIRGFPARSFIRIGVDEQPRDGEWHTTADGQWKWKADTSSDEIVGHYFVYGLYYDLVANDAEKAVIRALVDRMTSHILDNDFQLIDVDGKRTRWGFWGPSVILEDPDETGLRALHMLSHLRVASHITGNPRYAAVYDDLVAKHNYHLLLRNQKINIPGRVNHSDDELAFLSYYPLLMYEKDEKLRAIYTESLERSWQVERPERSPLWNFIYAAGTGAREFDLEPSMRTLEEIPLDLVSWTVTNSHRRDIVLDASSDRFGRRQSGLTVLPYDELPMMKWNGSPYRLDGGNGGRSEDDGAYFLLPYWMGRYHDFIKD